MAMTRLNQIQTLFFIIDYGLHINSSTPHTIIIFVIKTAGSKVIKELNFSIFIGKEVFFVDKITFQIGIVNSSCQWFSKNTFFFSKIF